MPWSLKVSHPIIILLEELEINMQLSIPIYYYPLKVLFVDDDADLLQAYQQFNIPNQIEVQQNPEVAIELVQKSHNADSISLFDNITEDSQISLTDANPDTIVGFTYKKLNDIINDQDKYQRYNIVVTDYHMPNSMHGLELCAKLQSLNLNVMKVLLTGAYTTEQAISALNNESIDYFIPKSDLTPDKLAVCISQLQLRYFYRITEDFIQLTGNNLACFTDVDFANLLTNFIQKNKITEYYLLNHTGCYLLKNAQNKFVLNIYTDEDLNQFCNMYSHLSPNLLQQVKDRKLIPHFEIPSQEVTIEHFYPAENISKYYYNFVKLE